MSSITSRRRFPSPFLAGDRFTFQNRHGRLTLEALGGPIPINKVFLRDLPTEFKLTLDELEKISLITDQVCLQLFPGPSATTACGGVVRHATPSTAAFCKVVELEYYNPIPAQDQIRQDMAGRGCSSLYACMT